MSGFPRRAASPLAVRSLEWQRKASERSSSRATPEARRSGRNGVVVAPSSGRHRAAARRDLAPMAGILRARRRGDIRLDGCRAGCRRSGAGERPSGGRLLPCHRGRGRPAARVTKSRALASGRTSTRRYGSRSAKCVQIPPRCSKGPLRRIFCRFGIEIRRPGVSSTYRRAAVRRRRPSSSVCAFSSASDVGARLRIADVATRLLFCSPGKPRVDGVGQQVVKSAPWASA